jgi:hypothetical protein
MVIWQSGTQVHRCRGLHLPKIRLRFYLCLEVGNGSSMEPPSWVAHSPCETIVASPMELNIRRRPIRPLIPCSYCANISGIIDHNVNDLRAAHHACPSKHRIMNRIRGYISILPIENDFDHNEIVDMLQIITDCLLGVSGTTVSDHQVSRGPDGYLTGNVRRQNELTIAPTNCNLSNVREGANVIRS